MIWGLSALSSLGFLTILGLSLIGPRLGLGSYWPPEETASWQHQSFRALFRVGVYPLVAASAILGRDMGFALPFVGCGLLILGFGCALLFTGKLGWKQAFGSAEGLVTTSVYAYSRNPVYVATMFGMLGWAVLLPYAAIVLPLLLWAVLYILAPFLEEPWLEARFGDEYLAYKEKTPRFLWI